MNVISIKVEPVHQETASVAGDRPSIFQKGNLSVMAEMQDRSRENTETCSISLPDATTTVIKTEPAAQIDVLKLTYERNQLRPYKQDKSDECLRTARMSDAETGDVLTLGKCRPFPVSLVQVNPTSVSNTEANNVVSHTADFVKKRGNIAISKEQSPEPSNNTISKALENVHSGETCSIGVPDVTTTVINTEPAAQIDVLKLTYERNKLRSFKQEKGDEKKMDVMLMEVEPVDQQTTSVAEDGPFLFQKGNHPEKEMDNHSMRKTDTSHASTIGLIAATTTMLKKEPADLIDVAEHPIKCAENESRPVKQDQSDECLRTARMGDDETSEVLTLGMGTPFPVALYQVNPISISSTEANNVVPHTADFVKKRGNIAISEELSSEPSISIENVHSGRMPYSSIFCAYIGASRNRLVSHERTHTGEKPYRCSWCPYSSAQEGTLKRHERTHTGEKPHKCSLCPYSSALEDTLKQHERTHSGEKPYKCSLCPYSSTQKGTLKSHERTHTDERPYKCSLCSYTSSQKRHLKSHERTHIDEKPYKCSLCSYCTKQKGQLKQHERTHTGEKPYKCSLCPYRSTRKGYLKSHERTHTGEKPYKCSLCTYCTHENRQLKQHERTHTGEKPYKCSLCPYSSTQKGTLKKHERTHTGERPYKCSLCPYTSSQKGHLKEHERTHTDEKPYKCSLCSFCTKQKGQLKQHGRTHTGERPYKCSLCPYSGTTKGALNRHERTHNGVKPYTCSVLFRRWRPFRP